MDATEDALDKVREEWSEFGVISQTAGKKWLETKPVKDDSVLGFLKWRRALKMSEVSRRIQHGLSQQNAARRQLVINFNNVMKTLSHVIKKHDLEVAHAKAAKLAKEQHEESDD